MNRYLRRIIVSALLILSITAVGCSNPEPNSGGAPVPKEANPAAQLAQQKCTMCHTFERVEDADKDQAGWEETVNRMEENGLVITEEEKQQIIDYLAEQDRQ